MSVYQIKEQLNEIRSTLLGWLSDTADYPVVIADESDPRPAEPHLALSIHRNLVHVGAHDEFRPATDTTPFTVVSHRNLTVSITAAGWPVGPDDELDDKVRALDLLAEVQLSLERPSVQARLRTAGLAIIQEGEIIDVSAIQETETEPRAVLDVIFGIAIHHTDDPGIISHAEISGEIKYVNALGVLTDKVIEEFTVSDPAA